MHWAEKVETFSFASRNYIKYQKGLLVCLPDMHSPYAPHAPTQDTPHGKQEDPLPGEAGEALCKKIVIRSLSNHVHASDPSPRYPYSKD